MAANYSNGIHLFTSESVSMGHPDKVADQISDGVLDSLLAADPMARVACETLCTTGLVIVAGEVTVHNEKAVQALNNVEDTVRRTLRQIGYTDPAMKFDAESCAVIRTIHGQSGDIAMGVDKDGAGDQGLMFGYACNQTPEYMPVAIAYAHRIINALTECRQKGRVNWLRPDSKSQVTVEYNGSSPVGVSAV